MAIVKQWCAEFSDLQEIKAVSSPPRKPNAPFWDVGLPELWSPFWYNDEGRSWLLQLTADFPPDWIASYMKHRQDNNLPLFDEKQDLIRKTPGQCSSYSIVDNRMF